MQDLWLWTFIDSLLNLEKNAHTWYTFCFEIDKQQYQYKKGDDKNKNEQTKQ